MKEFPNTYLWWKFIESISKEGNKCPYKTFEWDQDEGKWIETGDSYLGGVVRTGIISPKIPIIIEE